MVGGFDINDNDISPEQTFSKHPVMKNEHKAELK